jgi:hypothetical protein
MVQIYCCPYLTDLTILALEKKNLTIVPRNKIRNLF